MSHFYSKSRGSRKTATCIGTKKTGITSHISSFTSGIFVECKYIEAKELNQFDVYITKGSNKDGTMNAKTLIGQLIEINGQLKWKTTND